ncbi:hypothetical protein FRC02_007637 [Tulasnella sp. 418]|nr:hypothetical protein FRC02_007637 [Tulasnella sp. 418]
MVQDVYASNPVLLTHVSRYWRDAAIGCRPLWSFISLFRDTPLEKIAVWLGRSGNCPLDVVIRRIGMDSRVHISKLLIPHAHRWRSIHMEGGLLFSHPPLFKLLEEWLKHPDSVNELPKLQVLKYDNGRFDGSQRGACISFTILTGKALMGRLPSLNWEDATKDMHTNYIWKDYIPSLSQVTHLQFYVHANMFNE